MRTIAIVLMAVMLSGCATLHRHPTVVKVALISAGAVAGIAYAKATEKKCPNTYEGKPYDGTPPCPK